MQVDQKPKRRIASRAVSQPLSKTRQESSSDDDSDVPEADDEGGSWINSSGDTQNLMQNDLECNDDISMSQSLVSLGNIHIKIQNFDIIACSNFPITYISDREPTTVDTACCDYKGINYICYTIHTFF